MDTKQSSPSVTDSALRMPNDFPELPDGVIERFPEMRGWLDSVQRLWTQNRNAVDEFARSVLDVTNIAGILIVDPNIGGIYVKTTRGAGAYRDPDTPFYVDKAGRFSLGSNLYWNPEDSSLTVDGTIIAVAGSIGGWDINATTISKNNAVLDSAGQLALGTGNDIVIVSATDPTYRLWVGDAAAATATFSVTKAGAIFSTSGTIGGFSLGTDYIRDTANSFGLASTVTGGDDVRFWAGDTFANRATAPFRVTEAGVVTATSGTIGGFSLSSTSLSAGSGVTAIAITNGLLPEITLGDLTGLHTEMNRQAFEVYRLTGGTLVGYLSANLGYGAIALYNSAGPAVTITLDGDTGTVTATLFSGSGASLTTLNATNISSGTVATARLGSGAAGATVFLRGDSTWAGVTSGNVSGLASSATTDTTNASNISSGTLGNARLPSAISVTSLTASNEIRGATARFGTFSALGAEVLSGYISITDDGGNARKLGVIA